MSYLDGFFVFQKENSIYILFIAILLILICIVLIINNRNKDIKIRKLKKKIEDMTFKLGKEIMGLQASADFNFNTEPSNYYYKTNKESTVQENTLKSTTNNYSPLDAPIKFSALSQKNFAAKHKIITAYCQHQGTRDSQQDSLFVSSSINDASVANVIGVVCDGMGGMESGALASRTTVNTFVEAFKLINAHININEHLRKTTFVANKLVYNLGGEADKAGSSGTTVVCAVISNNALYWVSVGDSRIYIIRNNEIVQVTKDHNYLLSLMKRVDNKEITLEEALSNSKKDALISYIGIDSLEIIDNNTNPFFLENNDIVLLCSDGLTRTLSDKEILNVINKNIGNLNEAARLLPIYAFDKAKKGQDNTSVVLMQFKY